MANPKLTVTITADGYVTIATSANLATIQKCLSVICEERLANPPSAEAVALEAAEKRLEEKTSEIWKLESRIKDLEKLFVAPKKEPANPTAEGVLA